MIGTPRRAVFEGRLTTTMGVLVLIVLWNAAPVLGQRGPTGEDPVTSVTASAPLHSTGGTAPNITLPHVIIDVGEINNSSLNTAIGFGALSHNQGLANTAIGQGALGSNTTGIDNTASGVSALLKNTEGNHNTAIGQAALAENTSGSGNTASGLSALAANTTGQTNTASGMMALVANTTGENNTASGAFALQKNETGSYNTASGWEALVENRTGSYNTAIGYFAGLAQEDDGITNATAIGARARVDASNKVRIGDRNVTVIEGQVAFSFSSDKNQKEHFKLVDEEEILNKIRQIPVQSWNYLRQNSRDVRHYGPVAQDFFAAFGHDGIGTIGTPTTINVGDLAGILMAAIKGLEQRTVELRQTTQSLTETVEALRADNAHLKARLERRAEPLVRISDRHE